MDVVVDIPAFRTWKIFAEICIAKEKGTPGLLILHLRAQDVERIW